MDRPSARGRLRHPPPRALLDRRPGGRGAAAGRLRGRARVRYAAARGRARRVARRLPVRPCARRSRCWSPRAWPPASPTAASASRAPTPTSVRDVSRARAVLETAGVRHWPDGRRGGARRRAPGAGRLRARGRRRTRRTSELNQRHLAIHLSLVGLTGSPRLVAMADVDRGRAPARPGPDRPGTPQRARPGRHPPPPARPARGRRHRRRPWPSSTTTSAVPRTRSSSGCDLTSGPDARGALAGRATMLAACAS